MTEDIDLTRHRLLIEACLRHRVRFFWRSPGTLLIDGRGIRAVIDDLQSTGQAVIGLEGFELESTIIHPRIDLIFDAFSRSDVGPVEILDEWPREVWIDVTLEKR